MRPARKLIIFEGPDGAGKTSLAKTWAEAHGAHYVHLGPFPGLSQSEIARFYADAMSPAVLGLSDVAMDRCWLSEPIYADAFRNGQNRVLPGQARALERLAWRCQTTVVRCLPPVEQCIETFKGRRGEEYLNDERQLSLVHHAYTKLTTSLPSITINPFRYSTAVMVRHLDDELAYTHSIAHFAGTETAGNIHAKVALVISHSDKDIHITEPFITWPYSGHRISMYCASYALEKTGIGEDKLFWVFADHFRNTMNSEFIVAAAGPEAVSAVSATNQVPDLVTERIDNDDFIRSLKEVV